MRPIFRGIIDSIPIALGYFPIAFSFGLVALQNNLSPLTTIAISAFIFAGASQFVLISLIASGGSVPSIISTVLFINVRHLFYGPPVLEKIANTKRTLPLPLLSFGLTDEVFATAIGKMDKLPPETRQHWYLGLEFGAYLSWITGTAMGVFLGKQLIENSLLLNKTLGFVLPALFFTLLLELIGHFHIRILIGALIATSIILLFYPTHFAIIGGMIFGALLGRVKT